MLNKVKSSLLFRICYMHRKRKGKKDYSISYAFLFSLSQGSGRLRIRCVDQAVFKLRVSPAYASRPKAAGIRGMYYHISCT